MLIRQSGPLDCSAGQEFCSAGGLQEARVSYPNWSDYNIKGRRGEKNQSQLPDATLLLCPNTIMLY